MTFLSNIAAIKFEQKKYAECIEFCAKALDVGKENKVNFKCLLMIFPIHPMLAEIRPKTKFSLP